MAADFTAAENAQILQKGVTKYFNQNTGGLIILF